MSHPNSLEPVEFTLADGVIVRGVARWSDDAVATLLCLHDFGTDLDALGGLPAKLVQPRLSVVAIDLRGHGVSGGDSEAPESLVDDTQIVVDALLTRTTRVGLLAVGDSASAGVALGADDGVSAQVLITPHLDSHCDVVSRRRYCIRLVLHSEGDRLAGTPTQAFLAPLLGEQLMVSNTKLIAGPRLLESDEALLSHIRLFLKRYLVAPTKP